MPKLRVICDGDLVTPEGLFRKGDIIEQDQYWARVSVEKDKTCEYAPDDAPVSVGRQREVDRLDLAMQKKDLEAAKAAAAGIQVPDPALDPKKPAAPVMLPDGVARKIGDANPPK